MNQKLYQSIVNANRRQPKIVRNALWAFFGGGLVGVVGQAIMVILRDFAQMNQQDAMITTTLIAIVVTAIATGFGVYDDYAAALGAGAFIPISGFSNSLTSAALECKSEGLIYGIGSNIFKLAGSVLTYGIVSAFIFSIIRYVLLQFGVII